MSAITRGIAALIAQNESPPLATLGPWHGRPNPGPTTLGFCGVDHMNAVVVRMGGSSCY
jgi:hypothetical protein